jgi:hypothetical protein
MTIERPMFPPRADECAVFDFASFALAAKIINAPPEPKEVRRARLKAIRDQNATRRAARLAEVTTAPEKLSDTCKNHRLRQSRRDAWREASRLTNFARARMDWRSALSTAQSWDVAGADSYPKSEETGTRLAHVDVWRAALTAQLLTPAPDIAAVNWKRVQLRGGQHRHTDVTPGRIERAIAADVEWLNTHPSRKSIAAARQSSRPEQEQ